MATMAQDIGAKPEIANKVEKHYSPYMLHDRL
jgi:hypothetical protein